METQEGIRIRGFYRLQITENGEVVGDTGYFGNQVTNDGLNDYILQLMSSGAGSKRITHVAIGTGTAPNATHTTLNGELTHAAGSRAAATLTTASSTRLQVTATLASSDSFATNTFNMRNVGLFNTSTTDAGQLFAGNTYAATTLQTNQNINITYNLNFATS